MAQSHPKLGRLEPFYGTYERVSRNPNKTDSNKDSI